MNRGPQGPTLERLRLSERVRLLHEEGLTYDVIAARLGISRSYANAVVTDPDGSKERRRKESYAQPCPNCGAPMCGSYGKSKSSLLCADCAPPSVPKEWTRERIIEVFQAFAAEFGRPPTSTDKGARHPSQQTGLSPARLQEVEDMREFRLPHAWCVAREFGGWGQAVEAAGFRKSGTGGPTHRGRKHGPRQAQVLELLASGPKRLTEIRDALGISESVAGSALHGLMDRGEVERVAYGIYRNVESPQPKASALMAREFVVFSRNGTGWIPRETVEAPTAALAVEKIADGEGVYAAVPASYWHELTVGTVTKLAVIAEPAAA